MRRRTPVAFAATFLLFVAGITAGNQAALKAYAAGGDPYAGLDTFSRALTQIQRNHVEERDTQTLVWAAIRGMAQVLDPHSMFFDPETYARILEDQEGRYYGVGLETVSADGGGILVVDVLARSPAELAGVLVGDRIVEVDGEDVTALDFELATARIKGPRGERVAFGIDRAGERLVIEVTRDEIITPIATGGPLAAGVGYARLDGFREGTAAQLEQVIAGLEAAGPLEGLVLDLRGNPGGLLSEAAAVADLFVAGDDLLVTTRGRIYEELEEIHARSGAEDRGMDLVILVDGDSASGSEIVAGALQDLGRATVVGEPTWGKGSVQRIYEYDDGSALKLTVARYYLPSGRQIDPEEGIIPDVRVPLSDPSDPAGDLRQGIEAAVDEGGERQALLALLDDLSNPAPAASRPSFRGAPADRLTSDRQLRAALDILRGDWEG